MIMSKTATQSPPQHHNEALAKARLELLSNTALLKKVMDSEVIHWKQQQQQGKIPNSEEQKKSTMEPVTPPRAEKTVVASPPKVTTAAATLNDTKKCATGVPEMQKPAIEKSSSTQAAASPTASTVSPVGNHNRLVFVPPSTSYASLLLPGGAAAPPVALSHHQLQTLALAHHHLPHNVRTAMAMMAHHQPPPPPTTAGKIYGGPNSAFSAARSPIISRQTSPTQSAGESPSREGPPSSASYEAMLDENRRLQQEMKQKDETIATLQNKADGLEKQIFELRQLPTGKISHIPIEDMIRIMQDYGSEVSNQTLPKRKQPIQKASIVRQFRRWNPEFFRFFVHVNGEWVPRLGRDGELKRRAEKRRSVQKNKRAGSPDSTMSH